MTCLNRSLLLSFILILAVIPGLFPRWASKCLLWTSHVSHPPTWLAVCTSRSGLSNTEQRIAGRVSVAVTVKLSLCLTNQALRYEGVWGSWCIDPHFLDLGTGWRWVVSFTPRPLYQSHKISYEIYKKVRVTCFECYLHVRNLFGCRSQWPLGSRVRIPLKAWMSVLCAFILCLCCCVCR
jgi:hypothetical protein